MKDAKDGPGKVYQQDSQTGAYLVEIALDQYENVFNEWDPAPFKRRDIDPDLRAYLADCAGDIPKRFNVKLVFSIAELLRDTEKEAHVTDGLRNYLAMEVRGIRQRLRVLYRTTAVYLVAAVALLLASTWVHRMDETALAFVALQEGVTIGAWVFAWEAMSSFLFGQLGLRSQARIWRRYRDAEFAFHYR